MLHTKRILASIAAAAVLAGGIAIAEDHDIFRHHPNLGTAMRATHQAMDSLRAAQQANHGNLQGHAARALGLLQQANREIVEAARAADHR